jgi:hypothetical protein
VIGREGEEGEQGLAVGRLPSRSPSESPWGWERLRALRERLVDRCSVNRDPGSQVCRATVKQPHTAIGLLTSADACEGQIPKGLYHGRIMTEAISWELLPLAPKTRVTRGSAAAVEAYGVLDRCTFAIAFLPDGCR